MKVYACVRIISIYLPVSLSMCLCLCVCTLEEVEEDNTKAESQLDSVVVVRYYGLVDKQYGCGKKEGLAFFFLPSTHTADFFWCLYIMLMIHKISVLLVWINMPI